MLSVENIREAVPKVVAYKAEYFKTISDIQKAGFLDYLFPTTRDKLICKAVFDAMYEDGEASSQKRFISEQVDKSNLYSPMTISEITEVYEQAKQLTLIYLKNRDEYEKRLKDQETEAGRSRAVEIAPSGKVASDSFAMSDGGTKQVAEVKKIPKPAKSKKGAKIEKVNPLDLKVTKEAMGIAEIQPVKIKDEAMLRAKYEASLARRRDAKAYAPSIMTP